MEFLTALLVGLLTGYLGAIFPGPVNISVIRQVLRNRAQEARLIAVGGASMDASYCAAIGLGAGWFESAVSLPAVRLLLALFLTGYGVKITLLDRRQDLLREIAPAGPLLEPTINQSATTSRMFDPSVFLGALQGAANPTLIVSWTIMIGFLIAHGLIRASFAGGLGFALGVGIGCFGWLCSVIWIFKRFADNPIIRWWQRATVLGGAALILLGLYFTYQTLRVL